MQLLWSSNGATVTSIGFGVIYPGTLSTAQSVLITSSAITDGTFQTLYNLSLFLTGDAADLNTMLSTWPAAGGGVEVSFDQGATFQAFNTTQGTEASPLLIPAACFGYATSDGMLAATDSANILLRLTAPTSASVFSSYDVNLDASYDIV